MSGWRRRGEMEGTHEAEKDLPLACQEGWRASHFHKPGPPILLEYGT